MMSVALTASWVLPYSTRTANPDRVIGLHARSPALPPLHEKTQPSSAAVRTDASGLINAGLAYLVEHQNADGSFGGPDSRIIRVGLSALATLSILSDANVEHRGRYHKEATRGVRFLMNCATPTGERKGYFTAEGDTTSRMHGHGYATLALTQAYGMFGTRRRFANSAERIGVILRDAVSIIVRSQSRAGGWYYDPFDIDHDEGSITVCMLQALRGARNCGFHVPRSTIDRAVEYLHKSQNPDGSFRYKLFGDEQSSFELTAAATSSLLHAGKYQDRAVRRARDYLWGQRLDDFLSGSPRGYPYYGLFYAACVLRFDFDRDLSSVLMPRIEAWFASRFDPSTGVFTESQNPDFRERTYGHCYPTALATLTLQVHKGYLPVFDR